MKRATVYVVAHIVEYEDGKVHYVLIKDSAVFANTFEPLDKDAAARQIGQTIIKEALG